MFGTRELTVTNPSEELHALVEGRRVAVLTGAGVSTDSGIDYRGPDSPPRNPMTFQQFVGDPVFRQRYWARNHIGWRHMDAARPNAGHRAVASLERKGTVLGVITQNVDLLHTKAGSRRVIDLHGSYAQVRCLTCENRISRFTLHERLSAANPGFAERAHNVTGLEVAPDADASSPTPVISSSSIATGAAGCSNPTSCTSVRSCRVPGSTRPSNWWTRRMCFS